ncbi:MAG TPA: leishmanolysin-related zinc metalloendopeptidase [Gemmatimonadaceae bacterium]|nr:leishmanolysin-related zinc metalloendopeptidase [Gemmatimonadaceae bacterium]
MKLYQFVPALLVAVASCGDGGPPPRHQLQVVLAGTGTGSVEATAAGIDCGTVCSAQVEEGTAITLSADAGTSSTFTGWSGGGCTGTGSCAVTMSAAQTVTATFTKIQHALTVTTDGPGGGTVTSTPAGITCGVGGTACQALFDEGSQVTLTPTPDASSSFVAWSGNTCSGTGACIVTVNGAKTVAATFSNVSSIVVLSGNNQSAFANTALADPITLSIRNGAGVGIAGTEVTFAVMTGGGFLNEATRTTDGNGNVTAPAWTLGKNAVPQVMRVLAGAIETDLTAIVRTSYNIQVRFFGAAMSAEHQALFTTAAERISAIITGDQPDVNATGANISNCLGSQQPLLNEIIDDIVIYAAVEAIDGPGQVLASAGPCFLRSGGGNAVIGRMRFDAADINNLAGGGNLQDVIMHEMLHVIGLGFSIWDSRGFVTGVGSGDPRYTGAEGTAGCVAIGGTTSCAASVPLEAGGGAGTANSHWRESTFENELMTGFVDAGGNPISFMTIGALKDLGYEVNTFARDDYTIFAGSLRAGPAVKAPRVKWEEMLAPIGILHNGRVTPLPQ